MFISRNCVTSHRRTCFSTHSCKCLWPSLGFSICGTCHKPPCVCHTDPILHHIRNVLRSLGGWGNKGDKAQEERQEDKTLCPVFLLSPPLCPSGFSLPPCALSCSPPSLVLSCLPSPPGGTKCFFLVSTFREGGAHFGIQKTLSDTKTSLGCKKLFFGIKNFFLGIQNALFSGHKNFWITKIQNITQIARNQKIIVKKSKIEEEQEQNKRFF